MLDYTPLLRAQLVNLQRWVEEGVEPPPSAHPRLSDGTAVDRADALRAYPRVNGFRPPAPEQLWMTRAIDLGPDAAARVGRYPPAQAGRPVLHCAVSALDADGNELGGVRLPDLDAPVGTHAGWNTRHAATGAPEQIVPMTGSTIYFAATPAERCADDRRPALSERYEGAGAYEVAVQGLAQGLVVARLLLAEDVGVVVASCMARYAAAAGGEWYPPVFAPGNTYLGQKL